MEKDFVELYSLKDLAAAENHHPLTIRKWKRYIKVRVENGSTRAMYKMGNTKKPYGYKYIKWDDIKEIIEKQFWKKLYFE
jgi:hypothetical protein